MGRSVVYDPEVQIQLDEIYKLKCNELGLLLGQRTAQKDFVIYMVPLPEKDDDEEDDAKKNSEKAVPEKGSPKEVKNSPRKKHVLTNDQFLSELDESWACNSAKEVAITLPGGFDILGIYMSYPSENMEKLQIKAKEVLFAISKTLKKDRDLSIHSDITLGLFLHICYVTVKAVCRTFNVSDQKSSFSPAEWKLLSSVPPWISLYAQVRIDLQFTIKSEDGENNVKKQIESGLSDLFKRIVQAVPLINGVVRKPDELLAPQGTVSKKTRYFAPAAEQYFTIDLLISPESNSCTIESKTSDRSVVFTSKGTLWCRGYVHNKATVQEAVKAMQQDIIRSVRARCEIQFEDLLVIDEEQKDPVVVYELPKRVFAPLVGIYVCDYQFPGDDDGNSVSTFKELLNLEVYESDIESPEEFPDASTLVQPQLNDDRPSDTGESSTSDRIAFMPVAGAAIAAITAGLSYLLLWPSNNT